MNQKKVYALTALTLTAVMALSACGKPAQTATTTVVKETEAVSVATEVPRELDIKEAELTVTTWSSPNGATIHLSAVPESHEAGDSAEFIVRLNGGEISRVPCEWKDGAYAASVDLNAADGYGYYIAISGEQGAFAETPVNDEVVVMDEQLINLASSLNAYCVLTLEDAVLEDGSLTIMEGYAVVQAPLITANNENVACAKASLTLLVDGAEYGSVELTMAPGEEERSYDSSITDLSFDVPDDIAEGQQIFLRLDAVLTDGQMLTAEGGSWQYVDGAITGSVG